MDDDVKDRQEAQAHVTEVDWQVLRLELHGRIDLLSKTLKVQLLWVFLEKEQQIPFKLIYITLCLVLLHDLT